MKWVFTLTILCLLISSSFADIAIIKKEQFEYQKLCLGTWCINTPFLDNQRLIIPSSTGTSTTNNYYNVSNNTYYNVTNQTFLNVTNNTYINVTNNTYINQTVNESYFGTFNETEGIYVYNSTNYRIDFNETLLNQTIDARSPAYSADEIWINLIASVFTFNISKLLGITGNISSNLSDVNTTLINKINNVSANITHEVYNGTFNTTEGIYIYNSTPFRIDFNETKLNQTANNQAKSLSQLTTYANPIKERVTTLAGQWQTSNKTGLLQPDIPRALDFRFTNSNFTQNCVGNITILGIDQDGYDDTEFFAVNIPVVGPGSVANYSNTIAWAQIYNYSIIANQTNLQCTFNAVYSDRLGLLHHPFSASTNVYKITIDGNYQNVSTISINSSAGTVDLTTQVTASTKVIEIWSRYNR